MKNKTRKRSIVTALIVFLSLAVYGTYCMHRSQLINAASRNCSKSGPNDDVNAALIPCLQQELKAAPGEQSLQYHLAVCLASLGRYDEARPLFEQVAHSFGVCTLPARRMLKSGEMEKMKAGADHSRQARRDFLAVTAKDQREEKAFLQQHAVVQNGVIVQMSDVDKTQWLQLRERHGKEQKALSVY